jgi:hypothetical protein
MKTGKTYGRTWTVGPWQRGDKCGGCEVVCVGDDRPKNSYRIAPLDVHAVIVALCATTGQVVADPERLRTNPEREVVGWTVRAREGSGYIYPHRPGLGGLLVRSLKEAHRFNTRIDAVSELEWWGHNAHVVKITRRKAEVGR